MKRVLLAQFKHETNSFNEKATTIEDYKKRALLDGKGLMERYGGSESELGAYIEILGAREDIEIVPSVCGDASPGGVVTRETFEYFRDAIIHSYVEEEWKAEQGLCGHIDAIALALHGAQITEDTEDGEGLLLKEIRKVTGMELPIVVTLDFHANLTEDMVNYATALFPARYYPHTDFYDRGKDAADMLLKILDGEAHPAHAMLKTRLIYPHIPTDEGPLADMIPRLIAEGEKDKVYHAFFVGGFTRADISVAGAALYAITENDLGLAKEICKRYADEVYARLEEFKIRLTELTEAVASAKAYKGLTVIADAADNPGSGLMSDATVIIHELIRQEAKDVAIAFLWDPETVQQAFKAGPGATIHVKLGGKSNPIVGAPVETDAYVKSLSDGNFKVKGPMNRGVPQVTGPTAVLQFRGITCVCVSNRTQPFDEEAFRSNGVEPMDYHIIVVKSSVHYRAAWKRECDHILTVDLPNLTAFDEKKINYKRVPRPAFPLDSADVVRRFAGK